MKTILSIIKQREAQIIANAARAGVSPDEYAAAIVRWALDRDKDGQVRVEARAVAATQEGKQ